jgi:hypothetical protein
VQPFVDLYTRSQVTVPSLTESTLPTRISLTRTGEGNQATWLAEVEEVPGCTGRGANPEEALRRAWAAAEGSSSEPGPRHSGRLLVRMPATLHDELARAAASEGVSLNQFITGILSGAVAWRVGDALVRAGDSKLEVTHRDRWSSGRLRSLLLAGNLFVLLVTSAVAVALLVMAWR